VLWYKSNVVAEADVLASTREELMRRNTCYTLKALYAWCRACVSHF